MSPLLGIEPVSSVVGECFTSITPSPHLFSLGHPAILLQATDLSLQSQVGLLELADLLDELADVFQVAQT